MTGGTRLWATLGDPIVAASAIAVSPDGGVVFVTGGSDAGRRDQYDTVAYSASSGTRLWDELYNGGDFESFPYSMAISPDGSTVFVTGSSKDDFYDTVAYNAATGARRWVARYTAARGIAGADAIAVAPDGRTVYISGTTSRGITSDATDCETVAYQAATGKQAWAHRYSPAARHFDSCDLLPASTQILLHSEGTVPGQTMTVSPDGGTVYLAAASFFAPARGQRQYANYTTIALAARSGAVRWSRTYNGHAAGDDTPIAVAVSPDGRSVFVTGASRDPASGFDYATIAYNAGNGAQKWIARYNGPSNRQDIATSMTFGTGGSLLIVTGASKGKGTGDDYATVAYAAKTGRQVWVSRYNGPVSQADDPTSIAAGPGGNVVYVTGTSFGAHFRPNFATVSYDAATGAQRWASRYASPSGQARAKMVAVSPDGSRVFVIGRGGADPRHFSDYVFATVAYQG